MLSLVTWVMMPVTWLFTACGSRGAPIGGGNGRMFMFVTMVGSLLVVVVGLVVLIRGLDSKLRVDKS